MFAKQLLGEKKKTAPGRTRGAVTRRTWASTWHPGNSAAESYTFILGPSVQLGDFLRSADSLTYIMEINNPPIFK